MSPIEYIIQHDKTADMIIAMSKQIIQLNQDVTILKCVVWVFVGIVIGKIIAEIYFAYKD